MSERNRGALEKGTMAKFTRLSRYYGSKKRRNKDKEEKKEVK